MVREYRLKNPFSDPETKPDPETETLSSGADEMEPSKQSITVTEFAERMNLLMEESFPYGIWVEGELSDPNIWSSGHLYFSLKDDHSTLKGMMWARDVQKLKFEPEQGLKVICYGKPDFYAPRGSLSFKVRMIEPKGIGALQLAFDQMVNRLEKEGLFEEKAKKPLPAFPERVGVVTSPSGAAIGDMLKLLENRVNITLYPCRVQGDRAARSIVEGIKRLNKEKDLDLLIVGRGGGSMEDLWAFNEEEVARAIFESKIPVISAVGHEKDISISDMVADVRATTPTNAAEIIWSQRSQTQDRLLRILEEPAFTEPESWIEEWQEKITDLEESLAQVVQEPLVNAAHRIQVLRGDLLACSPQAFILHQAERLNSLQGGMITRMHHEVDQLTAQVHGLAGRLHALSPLAVLERGYSITFDEKGKIIKQAQKTQPGDLIETRLHRGKIKSRVESISRESSD